MKKLSALLLLFVLPAAGRAQDGYALGDCLETAALKSPEILRERAVLDEAEAGRSAALGPLLPQLDATLSYQRYEEQLPSKRAIFGASLDNYYSDLTLKQLLFAGGKYKAQLNSATAGRKAQRGRLSQAERDLRFAVTRAYYEQLRAAHTLEIQKSLLEKVTQQRITAELLYNGGKASVVDTLKTRAVEAAQRDAVKNAENQAYVKALALGQAMGLEEPARAAFAMPFLNKDVEFLKELPAAELDKSPEVLYAAGNLERAGYDLKAARAEHYPALYARGSYFMEDKAFFPGNANSYAGLFLSVPFYRGGALAAQADRAEARRRLAAESARKARLSVTARYAAAVSTALDKKERAATSAQTLELAKEALTASELRYSAGKITLVELLDSQNLWSSSYLAYANTVFDYLISAAEVASVWPEGVRGELLK